MKKTIYPLQQLKWWQRGWARSPRGDNQAGFTLLEVLVVVLIVGILAAMGIPSWLALLNNTRLNTARSEVFQAMSDAQSKAKQRKATWEASFQNGVNSSGQSVVQWSVHADGGAPIWQTLGVPGIQVEAANTNLGGGTSPYTIEFDYQGRVVHPTTPQKITLSFQNGSGGRRCVIIQTIIGSMKRGDNTTCTQ